MLRPHAVLGKAGCAIPMREHPVDHKWYHIEVPVGVPSGSTQACSVFWSPPDVVHHWGCRLASLHWEISNLRCSWAPKPHVHLPVQRLVLRSFHRDRAVRASTGLHGMTRLACGRGSLSLGTYDAPTSCMSLKCYLLSHLSGGVHNSFWELREWPTTRAKVNAPAEEQQPDPEKRQDVLVERSVWAWEHTIYKWAIHYWLCTG